MIVKMAGPFVASDATDLHTAVSHTWPVINRTNCRITALWLHRNGSSEEKPEVRVLMELLSEADSVILSTPPGLWVEKTRLSL